MLWNIGQKCSNVNLWNFWVLWLQRLNNFDNIKHWLSKGLLVGSYFQTNIFAVLLKLLRIYSCGNKDVYFEGSETIRIYIRFLGSHWKVATLTMCGDAGRDVWPNENGALWHVPPSPNRNRPFSLTHVFH